MTLSQIRKFWDGLWFAPQSPAPLCLFRILFGFLVFLSGLILITDLFTWFGPQGIVSIEAVRQWQKFDRFSLLFLLPETHANVLLVYVILLMSSMCLCLGLFTRYSAAAVFITLLSLHHRNPLILNSGDTLMRLIAFLLIFSAAGKMYSLDSLIAKRHASAAGETAVQASPWAQHLLQFQIAAVYCQTFFAKLEGKTWFDGTAVYYATRLEEFWRFPVPWLLDNIWTIKLLTWASLGIELSLWTLIWIKELRYWVLGAGVLLHLGIEWTMNIPLFELLMISSYILFIYADDVERFVGKVNRFTASLFARKNLPAPE